MKIKKTIEQNDANPIKIQSILAPFVWTAPKPQRALPSYKRRENEELDVLFVVWRRDSSILFFSVFIVDFDFVFSFFLPVARGGIGCRIFFMGNIIHILNCLLHVRPATKDAQCTRQQRDHAKRFRTHHGYIIIRTQFFFFSIDVILTGPLNHPNRAVRWFNGHFFYLFSSFSNWWTRPK